MIFSQLGAILMRQPALVGWFCQSSNADRTSEPKLAVTLPLPPKSKFSMERKKRKPTRKTFGKRPGKPAPAPIHAPAELPMRLNKYVAHCGICARRQAGEYVKQGLVKVNGEVELNPGYLVQESDQVAFRDKPIKLETRKVYILLNKPKNVITSSSDEKGRQTVLDIVGKEVSERIFPVGRLDRMTTGLLLITNDGDLAKKLSHPSHEIEKFYQVELDKPVTKKDLERIQEGVKLEDGLAPVDAAGYVEGKKNVIGIGIHIGRNRIVRRIFEHLGYQVVKLDRTYYAGLTKKDIPRGRFRHLSEREVVMLKHFK